MRYIAATLRRQRVAHMLGELKHRHSIADCAEEQLITFFTWSCRQGSKNHIRTVMHATAEASEAVRKLHSLHQETRSAPSSYELTSNSARKEIAERWEFRYKIYREGIRIRRHRSFTTHHHSNTARTACSQVSQDKLVLRSVRSKTSILNSQMEHSDGLGKHNTKSRRQRGTREPSL